MEVIINGKDLATITRATKAAIEASISTLRLVRISAGNYGREAGKVLCVFAAMRPPQGA